MDRKFENRSKLEHKSLFEVMDNMIEAVKQLSLNDITPSNSYAKTV